MCLSKVYIGRDDEGELLMEEVASLRIEGTKLLLKTLFGEEKKIEANIKQIDFMTHSIFLENLK
jgi:predicted RNA-binding protein